MKKDTKTLIIILAILVMCFGGMFVCMKLVHDYYDAQLTKQVALVKVGMSIDEAIEILPYHYDVFTEANQVETWGNQTDPHEIIQACHLYRFACGNLAMTYVLVYVDPETKTVRHISTQHM